MNAFVSLFAPGTAGLPRDATHMCVFHRWSVPLVFLVAVALCLPFLRTIFFLGDEGVLLHGAERMLQGDRIYADFFEFLPPGGFVLTELWLRIAGLSVLSERSLAIIIIAGIACFTFLACRQASRNGPLSAGLAIAWVVMSQGLWTQLNHHWITTMFSMAGVWAALVCAEDASRQWRWPLVAGAVFGMASMVTQTCGPVAMLAGLTAFFPLRRHYAAPIAYLIAGAVLPLVLILYLVWHHVLVAAFDDVVLFAATRYAPIEALPYGYAATWGNYPFVSVFPLAGLVTLAIFARDRSASLRDRMFVLGVAFSLAGFVACYPRADIYHVAFEVPLACPLLAYGASRVIRTSGTAYRSAGMGFMAAQLAPALLVFLWKATAASGLELTPTPRGEVAFFGSTGETKVVPRIAAMPPGGKWFFYPFMPMMPFLLARQDVSKYDVLTPGYSLPSQYRETCALVMQHAEWVVIDRYWTNPAVLKTNFPRLRDPRPPETRAFEQALDSNFDLVARDGTFELRHRRDGISEAPCTGMAK
jgi:hypothetical protein